jgi:hypothetical protein
VGSWGARSSGVERTGLCAGESQCGDALDNDSDGRKDSLPIGTRVVLKRDCSTGLAKTHATREFAGRHAGKVYMNFFNPHQRGAVRWDHQARTVQVNRTEALDASRAAFRRRRVVLPRRTPIVDLFANHLTQDARILEEDQDTGMQSYKYIRTGANHFSLAFTYAWLSASDETGAHGWLRFMRRQIEAQERSNRS